MINISKYGFIIERLRVIRNKFFRFRMRKAQASLAKEKSYQKKIYEKLTQGFEEKYSKLTQHDVRKFITPLWKKYNSRLEKAFLPYPSFSFLQDSIVMRTMFATSGGKWLSSELSYLEKNLPKNKLKNLLEEEYVGDPLLLSSDYLTSHTSVHHLYHFIKYLNFSKKDFNEMKVVVEWGGGYGNMIRILKKFESKHHTYIMIDTPLFSLLQWIYLATVFGEKEVNLILSPKGKIIENKINIVSISFLDNFKIKADLFISTWALSESSKYSQDYVAQRKWFGAKNILLAFQENKFKLYDPLRVGKLAQISGAKIMDVDLLPGNHHYAFL